MHDERVKRRKSRAAKTVAKQIINERTQPPYWPRYYVAANRRAVLIYDRETDVRRLLRIPIFLEPKRYQDLKFENRDEERRQHGNGTPILSQAESRDYVDKVLTILEHFADVPHREIAGISFVLDDADNHYVRTWIRKKVADAGIHACSIMNWRNALVADALASSYYEGVLDEECAVIASIDSVQYLFKMKMTAGGWVICKMIGYSTDFTNYECDLLAERLKQWGVNGVLLYTNGTRFGNGNRELAEIGRQFSKTGFNRLICAQKKFIEDSSGVVVAPADWDGLIGGIARARAANHAVLAMQDNMVAPLTGWHVMDQCYLSLRVNIDNLVFVYPKTYQQSYPYTLTKTITEEDVRYATRIWVEYMDADKTWKPYAICPFTFEPTPRLTFTLDIDSNGIVMIYPVNGTHSIEEYRASEYTTAVFPNNEPPPPMPRSVLPEVRYVLVHSPPPTRHPVTDSDEVVRVETVHRPRPMGQIPPQREDFFLTNPPVNRSEPSPTVPPNSRSQKLPPNLVLSQTTTVPTQSQPPAKPTQRVAEAMKQTTASKEVAKPMQSRFGMSVETSQPSSSKLAELQKVADKLKSLQSAELVEKAKSTRAVNPAEQPRIAQGRPVEKPKFSDVTRPTETSSQRPKYTESGEPVSKSSVNAEVEQKTKNVCDVFIKALGKEVMDQEDRMGKIKKFMSDSLHRYYRVEPDADVSSSGSTKLVSERAVSKKSETVHLNSSANPTPTERLSTKTSTMATTVKPIYVVKSLDTSPSTSNKSKPEPREIAAFCGGESPIFFESAYFPDPKTPPPTATTAKTARQIETERRKAAAIARAQKKKADRMEELKRQKKERELAFAKKDKLLEKQRQQAEAKQSESQESVKKSEPEPVKKPAPKQSPKKAQKKAVPEEAPPEPEVSTPKKSATRKRPAVRQAVVEPEEPKSPTIRSPRKTDTPLKKPKPLPTPRAKQPEPEKPAENPTEDEPPTKRTIRRPKQSPNKPVTPVKPAQSSVEAPKRGRPAKSRLQSPRSAESPVPEEPVEPEPVEAEPPSTRLRQRNPTSAKLAAKLTPAKKNATPKPKLQSVQKGRVVKKESTPARTPRSNTKTQPKDEEEISPPVLRRRKR